MALRCRIIYNPKSIQGVVAWEVLYAYSDGDLKLFNVERNDDDLWLNSNYGNSDKFWNNDNRFVFLLPQIFLFPVFWRVLF